MTGFISGLGSLFGGGTTPEEQRRAAIFQAGLATLASAQQPGATFGGSLFGGLQAGAQSLQQARQQDLQDKQIKAREEREGRLEKQQEDRLKLEQQSAASKAREQKATVAQRVASGIGSAGQNALGYYNVISRTPEFQSLAAEYGFDPASITTPEQVAELGTQLSALGGVGASPPPKDTGEPLEAVIGPNGQPVLRPRSQAVGATPYYRPSNALAVTLPDGTMITDGPPGSISPNELTKPTVNMLQENLVKTQDRISRLNEIAATYKPEYLQARGLFKAGTTKLIDKLGGDVSPEDREFFRGYSEFRANSQRDLNATIKELAGSAVTGNELQRTQKEAPNDNDSPIEFESKFNAQVKFVKRAALRYNYALKNGISFKSAEDLAKKIPLDSIDRIYEDRVNDIYEELGGTEDVKLQAIRQAQQEFGLAR